MVITRTPFRISFFGGGTDYPVWYNKHGGSVISTSINKYCYILTRFLPPFFNYKYRIRYTFREETRLVSEIKHPTVRECLKFLNIKDGIEMVHTSDLPARSGIGSSSSFTVGFLNCLYNLMGKKISKRQLALDAIYIEQKKNKENVGSQDQVIAAFGGFNKIDFGTSNSISVTPIEMDQDKLLDLQNHLVLFFTGIQRDSSEVSSELIKNTHKKQHQLNEMSELTNQAIKVLISPKIQLNEFGKLLDYGWQLKRSLSPKISNQTIDEIYSAGIQAGALGGKILGAGSGGFILFFINPHLHQKIQKKLSKLLRVPFVFERDGSQIIHQAGQNL